MNNPAIELDLELKGQVYSGLGTLYMLGLDGAPHPGMLSPDLDRMVALFKTAVDVGNAGVAINLANLYFGFPNIEKKFDKARQYFDIASLLVKTKNERSYLHDKLHEYYINDENPDYDPELAINHNLSAAELGREVDYYFLSTAFYKGDLIEKASKDRYIIPKKE